MTKLIKSRINDLEIENAELRRVATATLRDQFAMAALTGLLAREDARKYPTYVNPQLAYDYADKMMEARDADDV